MLITTKTHTEVNMSCKHLTINERNKIEVLSKEGYSSRRIAKILGFHHSTISRELKGVIMSMNLYIPKKIRLKNHHLKAGNQKLMRILPNVYLKNFIRSGLLSK